MTTDSYPRFNFQEASTSDRFARKVKAWLLNTAERFASSWTAVANPQAQLSFDRIWNRQFEEVVKSYDLFDGGSVGSLIQLDNADVPSVLLMPVSDLLGLVCVVLGSELPEEPESDISALTPIQMSMGQILFETFATSLSETWMGDDSVSVESEPIGEASQFGRTWSSDELVYACSMQLSLGDVTGQIKWLIGKNDMTQLLSGSDGEDGLDAVVSRGLVDQIPLELVCELGSIDASMAAVNNYEVGDVIVLNQRIDEPVKVKTDSQVILKGWPGRMGNQQGIEVSEWT